MTQFQAWIQSPTAIAVARTLLHSLWQAAVAAFALRFSLRFVHASRIRYAAGCAALGAIVLLSIGTLLTVAPRAGLERSSQDIAASGSRSHESVPANGFVELPAYPMERLLPWITPLWLAGCLLFSLCR